MRATQNPEEPSIKRTPLLLPVCISGLLMLWSTVNIYSSFNEGELPVVGWRTEHRMTFGVLWTLATVCVLYPTYLATIFLGISISKLQNVERSATDDPPWFNALTLTALVVIVTFCVRVTVTAWFPSDMHRPFQAIDGGLAPGIASLLISFGVIAFTFSLIRKLSFRGRGGPPSA